MLFLFRCFCFSSVGSEVDVSNESGVKIDHTEDQYLSINEQVKKENLGCLLYFGYQQQGKQPPSEPIVLKYFKTYYCVPHGSIVFYR
jgi:hypothetical protein